MIFKTLLGCAVVLYIVDATVEEMHSLVSKAISNGENCFAASFAE